MSATKGVRALHVVAIAVFLISLCILLAPSLRERAFAVESFENVSDLSDSSVPASTSPSNESASAASSESGSSSESGAASYAESRAYEVVYHVDEDPDTRDASFSAISDLRDGITDEDMALYLGIVKKGQPIPVGEAYDLAFGSRSHTDNVGQLLQNDYWMYSGCEYASLSIVLVSMGFTVDPETIIADDYVEYNGSFVTGFMGNPYFGGGVFPPGLAKTANEFLVDKGSNLRAHDITGTPFASIAKLAESGLPVLVWSTIDCEEPRFTQLREGDQQWYDNEHCVVVYGMEDGMVKVSDPLEGLVKRDAAEFERIYDLAGSMAVIIC